MKALCSMDGHPPAHRETDYDEKAENGGMWFYSFPAWARTSISCLQTQVYTPGPGSKNLRLKCGPELQVTDHAASQQPKIQGLISQSESSHMCVSIYAHIHKTVIAIRSIKIDRIMIIISSDWFCFFEEF